MMLQNNSAKSMTRPIKTRSAWPTTKRIGTMLLLFFILFASLCSSLEARKLHIGSNHKQINKVDDQSSSDKLFLSSLPKGTVPSSTPSKRGNAIVVDEKLVARRHLISTKRVLLRSVPSPGAGH